MQGFIRRRIPIFVRRAVTLAPALLVLAIGVNPTDALVGSQVVLSFGIPFALVPLLIIASKREVMGELVNPRWLTRARRRARGADHRPQRLPPLRRSSSADGAAGGVPRSPRRCAAEPEAVWERAMSAEGINAELGPLLRMTVPRGLGEPRPARARAGAARAQLDPALRPRPGRLRRARAGADRAGARLPRALDDALAAALGARADDRAGGGRRLRRSPTGSPGSRGCRCRGGCCGRWSRAFFRHRHRQLRRHFGGAAAAALGFRAMALADDFQRVLDALPPDWTDLELDLRIDDESRYIDTAVGAQPGQRPALLRRRVALAPAGRPQLRPRRRGGDGQGRAGEARRRRRRRRAALSRGARGPLRGRADVGPARRACARSSASAARSSGAAWPGRRVAADLMLGSKVEATLTRRRPRGDAVAVAAGGAAGRGRADRRRPRRREPGGAGRARGAGARLLLARRRRDAGGGRGGRGRPGRAALADGAGTAGAGRAAARAAYADASAEVRRGDGSPGRASTSTGCSSRPCSRSQAAHARRTGGSNGAGWRSGSRAVSWAACSARSRAGFGGEQVVEGLRRAAARRRRSRGGSRRRRRRPARGRRRASGARW